MTEKEKEAQAWLALACAAINNYSLPEDNAEGFESLDELVDDMCEVATTLADNMINEYLARFGSKRPKAAPRKGKRRRRESDEDE